MPAPRSLLARLWLPAAIVAAAVVSLVEPGPGRWLAERGAVRILVPAVMFLISLKVPGSRLLEAVRHPRALLGTLAMTFVVFPLVALGIQALGAPAGDDGRTAMAILAAQPSTLATAAVLTQIAGGNAALAVVCMAASQLASVVATPWVLTACVGRAVPVDAWSLALDLLLLVLVPILVGQAVRPLLRGFVERRPLALSVGAELVVAAFVLIGFAAARPLLWARPTVAAAVLGAVAAVHGTMLVVSTAVGILLRLGGPDRVAFCLVSSQKTVAAGILVWRLGFPGNAVGPIVVVLHHLVQTVADAVLAPQMGRIRFGKRRPFPLT